MRGTIEIVESPTEIVKIVTGKPYREITRTEYERKTNAIGGRRRRNETTDTFVIVGTTTDTSRRRIMTKIGTFKPIDTNEMTFKRFDLCC